MKHQMYYSGQRRGFYRSDLHRGQIPEDAVPISDQEWSEAIAGHAQGNEIVPDANGKPTLRSRRENTEHVAAARRHERNGALAASDALVQRHRDEMDMAHATTLSMGEFAALLLYRKALRELPQSPGWPHVAVPPLPS